MEWWYAGRSKPYDDNDIVDEDSDSKGRGCSEILPSCLLLLFGIVVVLGFILAYLNHKRSLPVSNIPQQPTHSVVNSLIRETPTPSGQSIEILVDDFNPQPYQGDNVYYFNRLEGDRGAINNSLVEWRKGQVRTTISTGNTWGGVWMSLNHPIRENQSINFSSILPSPILPAYQSQITGIAVDIAHGTPGKLFKLELKDGSNLRWRDEIILDGAQQVINLNLPPLDNINQLVWVLEQAAAGDYVDIDRVSVTATTQITDPAMAAFVWSYGMLLNNWNPATGLVRDKAKDASGEFDAIQATGNLAAATALAQQLGVIEPPAADRIVTQISQAMLVKLPQYRGLWPHWVKTSPTGEITIVPDTEWSSVDTAIAAIGLLGAQSGLGLDTYATEHMLESIDWSSLVTPKGISHGYTYSGDLIPYAWDVFGGESWLVELAYAGVTGQAAPMAYPSPPTANGSGFIDELAWLYVPPPSGQDYWGTDWTSYRLAATEKQILYYPIYKSTACFSQLGLFGLSAAEVPIPSNVPKQSIYQAFRVGGRFEAANDGSALLGASVVAPHYSAMIASLKPEEAVEMWDWLINNGHFSPLTNVESLMFLSDSGCGSDALAWNQLKGSWNLSLQTLGWGIYLTSRNGQVPILWQATTSNPFLQRGYNVLVPDQSVLIPSPTPSSISTSSIYERECEYPDEYTIGQMIWRSNASGSKVHGQFGTLGSSPWPAKFGYVNYTDIKLSQIDHLYLKLRYSKYSPSSAPIMIYLDDEPTPRAWFYPIDLGNWDRFTWTEPILLGEVVAGDHSIKFSTDGQQFGVADLDAFVLLTSSDPLE